MYLEVVDLPNSGIVSTEALLAVLGFRAKLVVMYICFYLFVTNYLFN